MSKYRIMHVKVGQESHFELDKRGLFGIWFTCRHKKGPIIMLHDLEEAYLTIEHLKNQELKAKQSKQIIREEVI